MARITDKMRQDVQTQAEQFLAENGFIKPPLSPEEALSARKLEVTQLSLDDFLVKANLRSEEQVKIQAVLDIEKRAITFKGGLPLPKRNWGSLHEIGHEYLPWHREVLYYCPLLWLPISIQKQMEAEADVFAAESLFFGSKFSKLVNDGEFGLATAKELADDVYNTSYHATFMRLAESSEIPCCLLVWRPIEKPETLSISNNLRLHYYTPSKNFRIHFPPNQDADDEVILGLYEDSSPGIIKHTLQLETKDGKKLVAQAESFSNSYNVFTLVTNPSLS